MKRRRVLFLCTGNACRSQIAEALTNARYGQVWEAYSAGTRPTGQVHPKALQVLAEVGILHQGRSKGLDAVRGMHFDLVVTVCDEARETCPTWPGQGSILHRGFPDPARVTGSEDEVLAAFRAVRDAIAAMLDEVLALPPDEGQVPQANGTFFLSEEITREEIGPGQRAGSAGWAQEEAAMQVQFFATLRDIVGGKTVDIPVTQPMTVQALLDLLSQRYPRLRSALMDGEGRLYPQVHVLINGRDVHYLEEGLQTQVGSDDEVSIFPAVGGG